MTRKTPGGKPPRGAVNRGRKPSSLANSASFWAQVQAVCAIYFGDDRKLYKRVPLCVFEELARNYHKAGNRASLRDGKWRQLGPVCDALTLRRYYTESKRLFTTNAVFRSDALFFLEAFLEINKTGHPFHDMRRRSVEK